jgi:hypothetical protein
MKDAQADWVTRRVPASWFTGPPRVRADREELLVTGTLPAPDPPAAVAEDASRAACEARIDDFREHTRDQRMRIAREAEHRFGRRVSWGATCGPVSALFTTASVPVMTRLRLPERAVLDTLVDAGVARSRSEALAWCVRLVARHEGDWLADLRDAFARVERVRAKGPSSR